MIEPATVPLTGTRSWSKLESLALRVSKDGKVPTVERDDPVGSEPHREYGHGGIHGAQRQVRVSANQIAHAHPVVRIRGNNRELGKSVQELGFHLRAMVFSEKIGHFSDAQRGYRDVGTASRQRLDARGVVGVRNVDRSQQRPAVNDRQQCRPPSRDPAQGPDPAQRGRLD